MTRQSGYFSDYLSRTDDRTLIKMAHYPAIYDRLLAQWQGRDVSFLEIGIYRGGSVRMWRDFFGPGARTTFVDIDPACKALQLPGTEVHIGDQTDRAFLQRLSAARGPFDLIVDDGGHQMHQQITSFEVLWPQLADGGLYIVEDTHTSYWPGFGGGLKAPGSFVEFAKDMVDRLHSWYTEDDVGFPLHPFAREVGAVTFHDSMVVIEKHLHEAPQSITSRNGETVASRRLLEIRGRRSIF